MSGTGTGTGSWVAVDAGASLAKFAIDAGGGRSSLDRQPSVDLETVARQIEALAPGRVGLTGCGASWLAHRLSFPTNIIGEFAAWGAGARQLIARGGDGSDVPERFLMVSIGTGTSVLLVDGTSTQRVGGTALGGGTLLGLGRAITGVGSFEAFAELAARGDSRRVDLLISDIYRPGEIALPGDATAAAFGRIARTGILGEQHEDLAAGITNLVAENVALLCGGIALAGKLADVAVGGSTTRNNPAFVAMLGRVISAFGCRLRMLEDGDYAGALGALELLRSGDY